MLKDYFDQFKMCFTVGNCTTDWQRLEKEIVTGCTISIILFGTAMNLLLKSVKIQNRGPTTKSGVKLATTVHLGQDVVQTDKV